MRAHSLLQVQILKQGHQAIQRGFDDRLLIERYERALFVGFHFVDDVLDLLRASLRPRCTAATGSSQSRARTSCSPVVEFISRPPLTGRELRSGSFTSMTPASPNTTASAPATAIFESLCFLAIA